MTQPTSIAAAPARSLEWLVSDAPVPHPQAVAQMQARVAAIRAGEAAEQVWLLEHPPLYTAGTSADRRDLSNPDGLPTYESGRGGQWTYHGPGQRIGYVMLDLTRPHGPPGDALSAARVAARDVRQFVAGLEEWLIRALDRWGVRGERREGRVGIWVADPASGAEAKIAAIGVRLTRWVSWHGVALNVAPDLRHFAGIVPCGIRDHGVTSLHALGLAVTMAEADRALRLAWGDVFGG